ncbi:MAG: hypothetical protein DMF61_15690 [Blastocatellia bacterium AA13]|nr:MAG: hypothetical protein DMF61_15690 [Blastocatellia bacterium AA13]
MLRRCIAFLIVLTSASISSWADGNKVELIDAFADSAASDSVKAALEPKGFRITTKDGVLCEVWLRNGIPSQAKTDVSAALYTEIVESSLIGVIVIPKQTKDYRGQALKPGAYTLRYALHPVDGNHMGISPNRDFLLMSPVSVDTDVNSKFTFQELNKMSTKTSGTNHASPLSLISAESPKDYPAVTEDDGGHIILTAKLKMQGGAAAPISFIVKGTAEQ